eukprot:COSAG06_NODE_39965_length_407_cov_0.399351_1_plen_50_part_10
MVVVCCCRACGRLDNPKALLRAVSAKSPNHLVVFVAVVVNTHEGPIVQRV